MGYYVHLLHIYKSEIKADLISLILFCRKKINKKNKCIDLLIPSATYLTVKDVLWRGFLKLDVPHQGHTIWLVGSVLVVVVGGHQQLRILVGRGKKRVKRR